MPTPMATMATAASANSGMENTLAHSCTRPKPQAMPKMAVSRGRPMASNEPKATNRMTAAARKPKASDENWGWATNMSPPSSTRTPAGTGTASTWALTRLPSFVTSVAFTSPKSNWA
jgi:hypothetical protein